MLLDDSDLIFNLEYDNEASNSAAIPQPSTSSAKQPNVIIE